MKLGSEILFYACFLGLFMFSAVFSFATRWWRTWTGRNVLVLMGTEAVLFGIGVTRRVTEYATGSAEWFEAHRTGITFWSYLALAFAIWWRTILLFVLLYRGKKERQERARELLEVERTSEAEGDPVP